MYALHATKLHLSLAIFMEHTKEQKKKKITFEILRIVNTRQKKKLKKCC